MGKIYSVSEFIVPIKIKNANRFLSNPYHIAHTQPYVDSESITPGRIGGQRLDFNEFIFTVNSQKITVT